LLYIGQAFAGPMVGLAVWLAAKLVAGYTVGAVGVIDLTRALRPILIVLVFWLAELLVLYYLAHALI